MAQEIKYIRTVQPTTEEKKKGAEVVFIYMYRRRKVRVLACQCYESWQQWGADNEVLSDNVNRVEQWRKEQGGDYETEH